MAATGADTLDVWFRPTEPDARLVGRLHRNDLGRIGFRYSPRWRRDEFAVSCSLPLTPGRFPADDGVAHRFFANLLPEGEARERIVRTLRIPNTDFDLLRALGGECAGALALSASESPPVAGQLGGYRALPDDELADLAARRGYVRADESGARPRLSLAGAQHKCPVLVRDGAYFLPVDAAPSTHILKFEIADFRNVPAYETFTTALAKAVGLETVAVELRGVGGRHFVEIARFDRAESDGGVARLHQEDFCQALGFGHERKYEADGGPSLADCVRLLRNTVADPVVDIERLMNWQAFNWLAGNSDGHAKNLALLYSGGTIRLAPFYDLVCTRAIAGVDRRLAMGIGGETDPGKITSSHWDALAGDCGVRPSYLHRLVRAMAERIVDNLAPVRSAFEERYGPTPALQRIESVVVRQCRRATE